MADWPIAHHLCTGNSCPVNPDIANQDASMTTSCGGSNSHGQKCPLLCEEGYTKSQDLACTAGSWNTPMCEGMATQWWSVGVGSNACCTTRAVPVSCNRLTHHADCCIGLARLTGLPPKCHTWVVVMHCLECMMPPHTATTPSTCPVNPGIVNQHPSMSTGCSAWHSHGQVCTLLCAVGYTKSGDLSCQHGAWNAPTCDGMAI